MWQFYSFRQSWGGGDSEHALRKAIMIHSQNSQMNDLMSPRSSKLFSGLRVMVSNGAEYRFIHLKENSIDHLYRIAAETFNVKMKDFYLATQCKYLAPGRFVDDFEIVADSIIYLHVRLLGGMQSGAPKGGESQKFGVGRDYTFRDEEDAKFRLKNQKNRFLVFINENNEHVLTIRDSRGYLHEYTFDGKVKGIGFPDATSPTGVRLYQDVYMAVLYWMMSMVEIDGIRLSEMKPIYQPVQTVEPPESKPPGPTRK